MTMQHNTFMPAPHIEWEWSARVSYLRPDGRVYKEGTQGAMAQEPQEPQGEGTKHKCIFNSS